MQKKTLSFLAFTFLMQIVLPGVISQATAQAREGSLSRHGSSRAVFDTRREF